MIRAAISCGSHCAKLWEIGVQWLEVSACPLEHENIPNTLRHVYIKSVDNEHKAQLIAVPGRVDASAKPSARAKPATPEETAEAKKFSAGFAALDAVAAAKASGVHEALMLGNSSSEQHSSEDDSKIAQAMRAKPPPKKKRVAKAEGPPTRKKGKAGPPPGPAVPKPAHPTPIPPIPPGPTPPSPMPPMPTPKLPPPVPKHPTPPTPSPAPSPDPLPVPPPHAAPKPGPPVYGDLNSDHAYFWVTRSNRSAKCENPACTLVDEKGRRGRIAQYLVRGCYHPDEAMVEDKRVWANKWWKYYHMEEDCIRCMPIIGIREWKREVEQGLELLIPDFAPLPHVMRENPFAPLPHAMQENPEDTIFLEIDACSDFCRIVRRIQDGV